MKIPTKTKNHGLHKTKKKRKRESGRRTDLRMKDFESGNTIKFGGGARWRRCGARVVGTVNVLAPVDCDDDFFFVIIRLLFLLLLCYVCAAENERLAVYR